MSLSSTQNCQSMKDLDTAAAGLAEASRLLSDAIALNSAEMIDAYYAGVRCAKARVSAALSDYRDRMSEMQLSLERTEAA
jgi:hypothetical protein